MFHETVAVLAVACLACVTGLTRVKDENTRIVLDVVPDIGSYFFNGKTKTSWDDAYALCANEGAHLVVIDSPEEADALKTLMTSYGSGDIHVGFTDRIAEGVYTFINDAPVDATLWAPGYPKDDEAINCGGFSPAGLQDVSCGTGEQRMSFCELLTKESYALVSGLGYYNYHVTKRTWVEAWEVCRAEGGHLFVPDNLDEVDTMMRTYPDWGDVWIGAHRLNGASAFSTVLGKPLEAITFTSWLPSQPYGDSVTRPYVALQRSGETGFWSHTPTGRLPFICEQAL